VGKEKNLYEIWWERASEGERREAFDFSEDYVNFLNTCKTEREVTAWTIERLRSLGFRDLREYLTAAGAGGTAAALRPGDKVYSDVRGKSVLAAVIGQEPAWRGVNIIASHIDSPRLDFKQTPLYEDTHLALAKTHYYGGIKKYQWVCLPLALRGVVALKDGRLTEINIGDREGDPCFVITDILPHLAQQQMSKKMSEAITGEGLNVLLASLPRTDAGAAAQTSPASAGKQSGAKAKSAAAGTGAATGASGANANQEKNEESEKVKANLLRILKESYGIEEKDFVSAEIEVVPALPARDVGFDRGLVGGYGQDDRVCSFAGLRALLDLGATPAKTALLYFSDKEEVGSQGNTGAQSAALGNFIAELCGATAEGYSDLMVRRCFTASALLSADVGTAVDPTYKDLQDPLNANYLGKGLILEKYTGSRGKSGGNDANPEFIAALRQILDEAKVAWQTGELGKVDLGGGGTVAMYMANMGMQVIDCGTPVLSMHAPFEITSKGDIYNTYLGYRAFLRHYK
jgi:aspartyl aminopeptidase